MNLFVSELISSVAQLCIFAFVPVVWWFFTARKEQTFWAWIGLKRVSTDNKRKLAAMIAETIAVFGALGIFMLQSMNDTSTAIGAFSGKGCVALPSILVYAIIHTSLSEEILFRGFLLKRISTKWGFWSGNVTQALLFGMVHGIGLFQSVGCVLAIAITLFTIAIALVLGLINEKQANGSILPSWLIHAAANVVAGFVVTF